MSEILVMQGIPGSGKTTKAREWVQESPETRIRINRDDIRRMLGVYWVPSREELVSDIEDSILNKAMRDGYDIVIDNMNLNKRTITYLNDIITNFNTTQFGNYNITQHLLKTPVEECISRDSEREHPIGKDTILGIYNKYKDIYGL